MKDAMSKIVLRVARNATFAAALYATLSACAAQSAKAPAAEASPAGYGQPGSSVAQPQAGYPPPPPPSPPAPGASPSTPGQPGGGATGTTSRSMALQGAANDVESSQRELDVAAGDCRNACRALGSMDRAAGKVCQLAQGDDEGRRCDDAKRRVYSARDRVKTTCGACPGGPSVERADPIPSLR